MCDECGYEHEDDGMSIVDDYVKPTQKVNDNVCTHTEQERQ